MRPWIFLGRIHSGITLWEFEESEKLIWGVKDRSAWNLPKDHLVAYETAQNRIAQPEDWPTRYTPSIITDTAPLILWPKFNWHTRPFFIYSHREEAMPYQFNQFNSGEELDPIRHPDPRHLETDRPVGFPDRRSQGKDRDSGGLRL